MRCWDADFRGFSCGFTLSRTTSLLMAWPPFTPRRGDVKNFQRPRVLWLGRDCPYHWRRTSLGDLKLGPGWVMWWVVWEVFFWLKPPLERWRWCYIFGVQTKSLGQKRSLLRPILRFRQDTGLHSRSSPAARCFLSVDTAASYVDATVSPTLRNHWMASLDFPKEPTWRVYWLRRPRQEQVPRMPICRMG